MGDPRDGHPHFPDEETETKRGESLTQDGKAHGRLSHLGTPAPRRDMWGLAEAAVGFSGGHVPHRRPCASSPRRTGASKEW